MPFQAVVGVTCVSAAIGSLITGIFARYPIALAPGMGLNACFTYSVVKGLGVPWTVALRAVFLSGVIFFYSDDIRYLSTRCVGDSAPSCTRRSRVASGCSSRLFGLRNSGVVVASPATLVTLEIFANLTRSWLCSDFF